MLVCTIITSTVFSRPSPICKSSCFKFNNNSQHQAKISCGKKYFFVEALANSRNYNQFDSGMNDGLGEPAAGQLHCKITFASGESYDFSLYNPFWGPLIEFTALNKHQLEVEVSDKPRGHKHYSFQW